MDGAPSLSPIAFLETALYAKSPPIFGRKKNPGSPPQKNGVPESNCATSYDTVSSEMGINTFQHGCKQKMDVQQC
jgi:hypothetical protein